MRGSNRYGYRPVEVVETADEAPLDFCLDKPKHFETVAINQPIVALAPTPKPTQKPEKVRKVRDRKYENEDYYLRWYLMNPDFQIGLRDGLGHRPFVDNHRNRHAAEMYEQGRLWGVSLRARGDVLTKMPRPVAAGGEAKPNGKAYAGTVALFTAYEHWRAWCV